MTTTITAPAPEKPCGGFTPEQIADLPLLGGSHSNESPEGGFAGPCCVVELYNRLTICDPVLGAKYGKPKRFNDDHPSYSRVVRRFLIRLNDGWLNSDGSLKRFAPPDAQAILKRYGRLALGTNTGADDDERRAYLCADWAIRVGLPQWLDVAGLGEHAATLRALAMITDYETLTKARRATYTARDAARERRDKAWRRLYATRSDAEEAAVAAVVAEAVAAAPPDAGK